MHKIRDLFECKNTFKDPGSFLFMGFLGAIFYCIFFLQQPHYFYSPEPKDNELFFVFGYHFPEYRNYYFHRS